MHDEASSRHVMSFQWASLYLLVVLFAREEKSSAISSASLIADLAMIKKRWASTNVADEIISFGRPASWVRDRWDYIVAKAKSRWNEISPREAKSRLNYDNNLPRSFFRGVFGLSPKGGEPRDRSFSPRCLEVLIMPVRRLLHNKSALLPRRSRSTSRNRHSGFIFSLFANACNGTHPFPGRRNVRRRTCANMRNMNNCPIRLINSSDSMSRDVRSCVL